MSGRPNYAARSIKDHDRPDPNIGPPTASASPFSRTDNQCFVDPLKPTTRPRREAVLAGALHPVTAKCAGWNFANRGE
jgi:hypothetical protein